MESQETHQHVVNSPTVLNWSSWRGRQLAGQSRPPWSQGVIGSFTYHVTMTLGAGALARPLMIDNESETSLCRLDVADASYPFHQRHCPDRHRRIDGSFVIRVWPGAR